MAFERSALHGYLQVNERFADNVARAADPDDLMPSIYQVVSYGRVISYRRSKSKQATRLDLKAAYFEDVCWNDEPVGVPSSDEERTKVAV